MTSGHLLRSFQSLLAVLIVFSLVLPSVATAQTPAGPVPPKIPNPYDAPKIFVLAGAGAFNFIPDRISKMVVVEVRDKNDQPMEGASVLFELPPTGPGGTFTNGEHSRTVRTDLRGQAPVAFELSQEQGRFQITVTATAASGTTKTTISQTNTLTPVNEKKREQTHWYTSKKVLIIGGVVVAGAVVGIVFATKGSKSSGPAVVITPGAPTFGG
jgi:hypothetical protein